MTKILIVEDDETIISHLQDKLQAEGFDVIPCSNGETALDLTRELLPDLIILDIMLPGLDGVSVCRIIRHEKVTAHIPIIMLTARGNQVDKIVGLESGADDYIVKPFGLGEFLARVRAVLRRPARQSSHTDKKHNEIISENIQLNIAARRMLLDDEEVRLSHKEFDLLTELMRNPGIVLSRDLILNKVWGHDAFVDRRTVDVHIRWLREKIEPEPSTPKRIITVRGIGYRFEG